MEDVSDATRAVVQRHWDALYRRSWDEVAACFTDDAHYRDVPAPDEGARGPASIIRRLRIGLDPIDGYEHRPGLLVVDGAAAVTEHVEVWHWDTGETVALPFVSVMETRDGLICRWWDYWDLQTLLGSAPPWWITHITAEYEKDPF